MRASPRALLLAASLAAAAGCLVDLDPAVVCGDGFVDTLAGEDCDPAVPASLAGRCPDGLGPAPGACDPVTCRFDDTRCQACGNGMRDPGEQCDPSAMTPPTCLNGQPASCRSDCTIDGSACPRCGNGVVDFDEECDPLIVGDFAVACADLPTPSGAYRSYGGDGVTTRCTATCRWSRAPCTYCGNDQLEDEQDVETLSIDFEGVIDAEAEVCDQDHVDLARLVDFCQLECGSAKPVVCAASCTPDCNDFVIAADRQCCTPHGAKCTHNMLEPGFPVIDKEAPCCWSLKNPGDEPCDEYASDLNPFPTQLCR